MDYELRYELAKTIAQRVLTPLIYMLEHENVTEFICFCDRKIKFQEIYDAEQEVKAIIGKEAEIIDIREFTDAERVEIVNEAKLIYSENPIVEKIFTHSVFEEYRYAMDEKKDIQLRYKDCGTVYLQ